MDPSEILHRCVTMIPDLVESRGLISNSCVLQVRVAIEVLDYFGIDAQPIPCRVDIFNPPLSDRIKNGFVPRTMADLKDEEWSIGLGYGEDRPGFWGGHLIVGCEANGWIMDPSLRQANRPRYDIDLEPLLTTFPEGFLSGEQFVIEVGRCSVCYSVTMSNQRYRMGSDWKDRRNYNSLAGEIIRSLKKQPVSR